MSDERDENRRSGESIAARLRMKWLERLPSRGFFLGNGMYLVYHPKREQIQVSPSEGGIAFQLGRTDIALLRRLLEAVGEFSVPDDVRYHKELAEITRGRQ